MIIVSGEVYSRHKQNFVEDDYEKREHSSFAKNFGKNIWTKKMQKRCQMKQHIKKARNVQVQAANILKQQANSARKKKTKALLKLSSKLSRYSHVWNYC